MNKGVDSLSAPLFVGAGLTGPVGKGRTPMDTEPQDASDYVVVGRVGPAHGVRGDVFVEPRTDEPELRFAPHSVVTGVAGAKSQSLTVARHHFHRGKLLVHFTGFEDRTAAERLRGLELRAEPPMGHPEDPEEYYDQQLVGLRAVTTEGASVGQIVGVQHGAQDLLVIATDPDVRGGVEVLVPFVMALVPQVDLEAGHVVIADRPGLLNPEAQT